MRGGYGIHGLLTDDLAPGFVATHPASSPCSLSGFGIAAWADLPAVRLYGHWCPGELLTIADPLGRLLIAGHCLESPDRVSSLFSAALESGALDFLDELPGAFNYIVWRNDELVVAGDDAGQYPVYFSRGNDEVLLGSHAGVLAALHGRAIDPVTLSARIACPTALPVLHGRSTFEQVKSVPPGARLRADVRHLRLEESRRTRADPARCHGASVLRTTLVDAVRYRSRGGGVTSDFSGGLDSTSLALLAAQYNDEVVKAFTYHQPLAPAHDLVYAERLARLEPKIEHLLVRGGAATLPYQGMFEVSTGRAVRASSSLTMDPIGGLVSRKRFEARVAAVAQAGSRVHLTGEGGDAVLGAPPAYLADVARHRSLLTLLRQSTAQARLRQISPVTLTRRARRAAAAGPRTALRSLARELLSPSSRALGWADCVSWWPSSGEAIGWLTTNRRRALADIARDPATARLVSPESGAADLAALAEVRSSARTQRNLREMGARFGVAVHAPFLDNPVLRACLDVRPSQRVDPWSYKPMLRHALRDLVPDSVFERRTKGDYTAEDYLGVRRAAVQVRALLDDSHLAQLGVIEPAMVQQSVNRFLGGASVPTGALNQLLAFELWLRGTEQTELADTPEVLHA